MDISFGASISGLRASETRQVVSSHNIANISTPQFESYKTLQKEISPEGTQASIVKPQNSTARNNFGVDLAQETSEQIVAKNSYSANLQVVKAKDKMLGELLDIFG